MDSGYPEPGVDQTQALKMEVSIIQTNIIRIKNIQKSIYK